MINIRDYKPQDQQRVTQITLNAFEQYQKHYLPWEAFQEKLAGWTSISTYSYLFVAEDQGLCVGAVALVPPRASNKSYFPPDWAAIRMLVVEPSYRGKGIGNTLMDACLKQAVQKSYPTVGLHTSPIMKVALEMYLKMGFVWERDIDPIYQVPYAIYRLNLTSDKAKLNI